MIVFKWLELEMYEIIMIKRKSFEMIKLEGKKETHLNDVTGTGSSRSLRQWSQLSVLIWSRSAVNNFSKSFPKTIAEEGVKNRIDTAVRVRQNVARYLHHYRRWCQWIHVQRFRH